MFTAIQIDIAIVAEPGDENRMLAVFESAKRDCIIARSLAVPVTYTAAVTAVARRAAG